MLRDIPGRRAVVLMTDGVDLNSKRTQKQVIERAKASHVPIYTIGIGEPGKNEPVTTVLVLDHSGSMAAKASDADDDAEDPGAARGGVALRGLDAADGRDHPAAVQQRHRASRSRSARTNRLEEPKSCSCSPTAARCCTTRRLTASRRWRRAAAGQEGGGGADRRRGRVARQPPHRRGRDRGGEGGRRAAVHARPGPRRRDQRAGHGEDGRGDRRQILPRREPEEAVSRSSRTCRSTCTTTASTRSRCRSWRRKRAANTIPAATCRSCP